MKLRPGFMTSEFWTVIISYLINFLIVSGKLSPSDGVLLTNQTAAFINGLIGVLATGSSIIATISYILSRTELKKTLIQQTDTITKFKDPKEFQEI